MRAKDKLQSLIDTLSELKEFEVSGGKDCCLGAMQDSDHGKNWISSISIKNESNKPLFSLKFKGEDEVCNVYDFSPEELGMFISFASKSLAEFLASCKVVTVK